jgi:hypothetical protein
MSYNPSYDMVSESRCQNPAHYKRMIALLLAYNPTSVRDEENAAYIINTCIREALEYGNYAIGCVAAYKTPTGKVRLFLEPLIPLTPVPALPTHSTEK